MSTENQRGEPAVRLLLASLHNENVALGPLNQKGGERLAEDSLRRRISTGILCGMMLRRKWISVCFMLGLAYSASVAQDSTYAAAEVRDLVFGLPAERRLMLLEIQETSHQAEHAVAESLARAYILRWPDDPTGYYARAVALQARHFGCEGYLDETAIAAALNGAVERANERLRLDETDVWARYLLGLALGFQSVDMLDRGRPLEAWKISRRSLSALDDVRRKAPEVSDALLPLGAYHFWRGRAVAKWSWIPFVKDTREQGLQELRKATEEGYTTSISAQIMLMWALHVDRRYEEALTLADSLSLNYPRNRSILQVRAEALCALDCNKSALHAYRDLICTYEPEFSACPGRYAAIGKLGLILSELGRCDEALPYLREAAAYVPPRDVQTGYLDAISEARGALKRCGENE